MECRKGCGACCIAPSIRGPIPGMPDGKPAGVACLHLDRDTYLCRLWGTEDYPETCRAFAADEAVCGSNRAEALELIATLEAATATSPQPARHQ